MAENNSRGLSVEGAGIYVVGLVGLGVVAYLAKQYFDDLQKKANGITPNTNVATAPVAPVAPVAPNGTPTPQINTQVNPYGSETVDGITIPAPSGGETYVNAQGAPYYGASDEFPLRFGQGGQRINNVQRAFVKLGLLAGTSPTRYFYTQTQAAVTKYFGKSIMEKADYVRLMKASGQLGGINSLRGINSLQGMPQTQMFTPAQLARI